MKVINRKIREDSMIRMTIYEALRKKLGRDPTNLELKQEVIRIKRDAVIELATAGKLPFQRRRR